jgi:uncharacterized membrane protein YccC
MPTAPVYNINIAALLRVVRVAVAILLPQLIAWLAGHPDAKWSLLAPIISGVAKYLRDQFNLNWLPV